VNRFAKGDEKTIDRLTQISVLDSTLVSENVGGVNYAQNPPIGCQYLSDKWSLANTIREVEYQLLLISLHSLAASSWASLRFLRPSTASSAFKVSCMLHPAKDPVTRTCEKSPSQAQLLLDKKDHLAWERLHCLRPAKSFMRNILHVSSLRSKILVSSLS